MRVITFNANGIRSAQRKGFFEWLFLQNADFICIQETKAQIAQLDALFSPENYHCFYHDAEKKGYSGVAIYAKYKPDAVIYGLGIDEIDREGRFIEVQLGNLSVVSLYLPSGSSGEERQNFKYDVLNKFISCLTKWETSERNFILCGDWNIAHKPIDLKNWKANQKCSGFLPQEREWLDKLFETRYWFDAFRLINQNADEYTWWSNRGQAWTKNVGWRIDYQIISSSLNTKVMSASIYKETRFSDHAPLIIDYQE